MIIHVPFVLGTSLSLSLSTPSHTHMHTSTKIQTPHMKPWMHTHIHILSLSFSFSFSLSPSNHSPQLSGLFCHHCMVWYNTETVRFFFLLLFCMLCWHIYQREVQLAFPNTTGLTESHQLGHKLTQNINKFLRNFVEQFSTAVDNTRHWTHDTVPRERGKKVTAQIRTGTCNIMILSPVLVKPPPSQYACMC